MPIAGSASPYSSGCVVGVAGDVVVERGVGVRDDGRSDQSMMPLTSLALEGRRVQLQSPPESNSPRGSQVTTLYPASRSGFRPGTRPLTIDSESGSVLPAVARPGPLRIVGAEVAPSTTADGGEVVGADQRAVDGRRHLDGERDRAVPSPLRRGLRPRTVTTTTLDWPMTGARTRSRPAPGAAPRGPAGRGSDQWNLRERRR